jgi:hypothetical protein
MWIEGLLKVVAKMSQSPLSTDFEACSTMPVFSKAVAADIVSRLVLEERNREFVHHWLSLWDGDALPPWANFSPAKLKPFLPSILLFEVVPDNRVTVRLAGTGYRYILKTDPTGRDWIAAAPESHRATRLQVFSAVARGAILIAHRRISMLSGADHISEEILLPFAQEPKGYVPVLVHVNFRPEQFAEVKSIAQVTGDPLDYKLIPLPAMLSTK